MRIKGLTAPLPDLVILSTNYISLRAYILGDEFPGHLELPDCAVVQGRHDLHEGTEVVELDTLCGQLDEELQDLGPVHEVPLVGHTPHEEMGHLQVGEGREPLDFIFCIIMIKYPNLQ